MKLGTRAARRLEKVETPGKQTEAPRVSQARLPFEFRMSVTSEGVGWALWQDNRRGCPLESGPNSGRRQKPDMHTPKEQQLMVVYVAFLLGREQIRARRGILLSSGGLRTWSMNPRLPWLKLPPCLSGMPLCSRGAPCLPVYSLSPEIWVQLQYGDTLNVLPLFLWWLLQPIGSGGTPDDAWKQEQTTAASELNSAWFGW